MTTPLDPEPEEYVVERVREELARDGRIAELGVEVHVSGNQLHLVGATVSEQHRQAIVDAARRAAPHLTVRADLAVVVMTEPSGTEVVE